MSFCNLVEIANQLFTEHLIEVKKKLIQRRPWSHCSLRFPSLRHCLPVHTESLREQSKFQTPVFRISAIILQFLLTTVSNFWAM